MDQDALPTYDEMEAANKKYIEEFLAPLGEELLRMFSEHKITQAQAAIVTAYALNHMPIEDGRFPRVVTIAFSAAVLS